MLLRLFALGIVAAGCLKTHVETMSHPVTLKLRLEPLCDGAVLEVHDKRAQFVAVPVIDAKADVHVPAMGGGYVQDGDKRTNVHDPHTYDVVRVRHGTRILVELSASDVEKLPRDAEGRAIVAAPCATGAEVARPSR